MRLIERTAPLQDEAVRLLVLAVERLAGCRTRDEVIQTLRATARNLVGADGICIVLRDQGRCYYIEEDAIGPLWKGGKFPMDTCISGWAMLNAKTVVIPDVFLDERIPHAIYRETFVKSLVMTPIGHDEPIAALGAYWGRYYEAPRDVVDTLEALARAASTALENAYLIDALSASLRKTDMARVDLRHRLANAFASIETYAAAALSPQDARELGLRLKAMSRAHELVDETFSIDGTIPLGDLIEAELRPHRSQIGAKIDLSGPGVSVTGPQAIAIGLVLNELCLQASRSPGLNAPGARLSIKWREEMRVIRIDWQQTYLTGAAADAAGNLATPVVRNIFSSQVRGTIRQIVSGPAVTLMLEFATDNDMVFPQNASVSAA